MYLCRNPVQYKAIVRLGSEASGGRRRWIGDAWGVGAQPRPECARPSAFSHQAKPYSTALISCTDFKRPGRGPGKGFAWRLPLVRRASWARSGRRCAPDASASNGPLEPRGGGRRRVVLILASAPGSIDFQAVQDLFRLACGFRPRSATCEISTAITPRSAQTSPWRAASSRSWRVSASGRVGRPRSLAGFDATGVVSGPIPQQLHRLARRGQTTRSVTGAPPPAGSRVTEPMANRSVMTEAALNRHFVDRPDVRRHVRPPDQPLAVAVDQIDLQRGTSVKTGRA